MLRNPFNMACIYMAAGPRLQWTEDQIMTYVVHTYQKNGQTRKKWFFDSFLVFDTIIRLNGQNYALSLDQYKYSDPQKTTLKAVPADKTVWMALLNKYFGVSGQDNGILGRFDATIAQAKQDLGEPGFTHRIVLGLPEPLAHYPNPSTAPGASTHLPIYNADDPNSFVWGYDEQDNPIVFRRIQGSATNEYPGCSYAVNWFIGQCLARWNAAGFQHLQLAGFYWVNEGGPGWYDSFDTIKNVKQYINDNASGLKLVFSPYCNYYNGVWTDNGQSTTGHGIPYRDQCDYFDIVFAQPNYSLGAGSNIPSTDDEVVEASQYTRFISIINKATNLGDAIDVEMDEYCLYGSPKGPKKQERVYRYFEALRNKFLMDLLYYNGNGLVAYVEDDNTTYSNNYQPTEEDHALIHALALFVDRRRRQITAYNSADINEDGSVDISDLQIILNEMLGQTTGYAQRADINQDGSINITDYNLALNVMMGHLSEMEDDE